MARAIGMALVLGGLLLAAPPARAQGLMDFLRPQPKAETKTEESAKEKPADKKPADKKDEAAAKGDKKAAEEKQEAKKPAGGKPGDVAPKQTFAKLYDRDYVGEMQSYTAKYEDTMVQLARTFNVGFVELRSANPFLDPWIPGEGKKVIVPSMHLLPHAPREGIVMNLAEMRMYAYMTPGKAPLTYPIGIGREGLLTPSGTTAVVRKKDGPTWRPTARMRKENPDLPAVVGPGPDNPMGTHALYLGWPEYAIHGTDKPYSIGRRSSAGCIRMYPENIGKVHDMVRVGTQVTVVNQSVKAGWIGDRLYLEAHPTMEQADRMEIDGGLPGYVFPEEEMGIIVTTAGDYARDLDWPLIRQIIRERRGYPVEIFHKASAAEPVAEQDTAESAAPAEEDRAAPKKEIKKDLKKEGAEKQAEKPSEKLADADDAAKPAEKRVEKPAVKTEEKQDAKVKPVRITTPN